MKHLKKFNELKDETYKKLANMGNKEMFSNTDSRTRRISKTARDLYNRNDVDSVSSYGVDNKGKYETVEIRKTGEIDSPLKCSLIKTYKSTDNNIKGGVMKFDVVSSDTKLRYNLYIIIGEEDASEIIKSCHVTDLVNDTKFPQVKILRGDSGKVISNTAIKYITHIPGGKISDPMSFESNFEVSSGMANMINKFSIKCGLLKLSLPRF